MVSAKAMRADFRGSVLGYLLETGETPPAYAWTNILPVQATEDLAEQLHVSAGTVFLLLEETTYTADNQIVNYSRNYFIPDHFQFHLIRRITS
jgi:DNA-binding GntR family transcriptional regulator